jgi:hypothetical protein
LRTGDLDAIPGLAAEMVPVRLLLEAQRHERLALLLFEQSCEAGRLTMDLVRQIASLLEGLRRPGLEWWSAWGTRLERELVS